jgi:hypothetical protein
VKLVTQRKLQECLKLCEEELASEERKRLEQAAEEERKLELAAEEKRKKDEARKQLIQGMMTINKMKATLRDEVKQISENYMELYVESVCDNRATIIAKSEFAKFKYSGNMTRKKLQSDVLKNLYNNCIYETMRVKAIQDVLPQIIKK